MSVAIDAIAAKVITGVGSTTSSPIAPAVGGDGGESFGASLSRLVGTVEESHNSANTAVNGMLTGQLDVHDAMIALQRAELSLQLTVQVRNKVVQAYQDIMRMPV